MIAALVLRLATRFSIRPWLLQLLLAAAAMMGTAAALVWTHHHIYHQGEVAADARNAATNKANSDRADHERNFLNAKVALAQANLTKARAELAVLQGNYDNEKAISTQRQLDLLAGRERMRILTRQRPADPNRPPTSGPAGPVDPGTAVTEDIDPGVSAWLEWFRAEHNAAVDRLNACIVKYDAVKAAADAMP